MTIETTTTKVRYWGNGITTVFPVSFPVRDKSHLVCVIRDPTGVETTLTGGYSVGGAFPGNATVTLGWALPGGTTLTIYRRVPRVQLMDLENGGNFDAEVIERSFDLQEMQIQELQELADRSMKVSIASGEQPKTAEELYAEVNKIADKANAANANAENCAARACACASDAANTLQGVNTQGAAWVSNIQSQGAAQIGAIQSQGAAYVASIQSQGAGQLAAIQSNGAAYVAAITANGEDQKVRVRAEGDGQATRVRLEGVEQVARATVEADRAENAARGIPGFAGHIHAFYGLNMDQEGNLILSISEDGDELSVNDYAAWDILPIQSRLYLANGSLMLELPFHSSVPWAVQMQ